MADEEQKQAGAVETTTTTTTTTTEGDAVSVKRWADGFRTAVMALVVAVAGLGLLFQEIGKVAVEFGKARAEWTKQLDETKAELERTQGHLNSVDARAVKNEKELAPLREVVTKVVVDPPNTAPERAELAAQVAVPESKEPKP